MEGSGHSIRTRGSGGGGGGASGFRILSAMEYRNTPEGRGHTPLRSQDQTPAP